MNLYPRLLSSLRHLLPILALCLAPALTAQAATPGITVGWVWAQGAGLAGTGFNIYSSNVSGGPYTRLTGVAIPITTLSFLDTTAVVEGRTYCYVVTTLGVFNLLPVESVNSPETCVTRSTKPASPGKPTVIPQ